MFASVIFIFCRGPAVACTTIADFSQSRRCFAVTLGRRARRTFGAEQVSRDFHNKRWRLAPASRACPSTSSGASTLHASPAREWRFPDHRSQAIFSHEDAILRAKNQNRVATTAKDVRIKTIYNPDEERFVSHQHALFVVRQFIDIGMPAEAPVTVRTVFRQWSLCGVHGAARY